MRKSLSVTGLAAALAYTLGLGFTVMRVAGIDVQFSSFLLYTAIIFAVVIPILSFKPCAIALAAITAICLVFFLYNFDYYARLAVQLAQRMALFFQGAAPLENFDRILISCVVVVPLSAAAILFAGRLNDAFLLTAVAMAFFVAAWELGYTDIMPGLCACSVSVIVVFAASYARKFVKSVSPAAVARRAALFALPLALIAVLICAGFAPLSQASSLSRVAFVEDFFDDIADAFGPSLGYGRERRSFNFSDYGYSSELGGPVSLSRAPVMTVSGATGSTLLRGSIKDEYTGHSWRDSSESETYRFDAPLQRKYRDAVFNADLPAAPVPGSFMQAAQINITLLSGGISTIFTSGRPTAVYSGNLERFVPYFDSQGELFSKYYMARETSYTVEDSMPRWYSSGFSSAVTRLEAAVADKKAAGLIPDPQYEEILEQYTRLPTLSLQVRAYASLLTAGQDTPYEKACAIMEQLRGSYIYSLDVPYVPYDMELVEWFMQTRVGYCTYFATAMTVLARASGIPARYVEGFSLYNLTPDKNGAYTVTGAQAHAWCEVYLEGIGWIPFDATAAGASAAGSSNSPDNNNENSREQEELPPGEDPENESPSNPDPIPTQSRANADPIAEKRPFPWIYLVLALFAAAAVTVAAVAALKSRFKNSRLLKKYSHGECLMLCWRDIMNMLKYWELSPEPGETCMALAERAGGSFSFEACPFSRVAQLTELYIYGGIDPGPEALLAVIDFRREMDDALFKKLRPFRYISCRIRWLI